jgi:F0F1-type ATP synthase epsilon subunit
MIVDNKMCGGILIEQKGESIMAETVKTAETFSREEMEEMKTAVDEFLSRVDSQWPGREDYEALSAKLDRAIGESYMADGELKDVGKWFRRED